MKIIPDRLYEWFLKVLPMRLMWVKVPIDSKYSIWKRRWGYTKRQLEESDKEAKELYDGINWK